MKQNYLILIRRLTILLIISGALNVGLFAFLIYWMIKERPPTPYCEHLPMTFNPKTPVLPTSSQLIAAWNENNDLTMEQLIAKLTDAAPIDSRLNQRDLALTSLITYHDFDLAKAMRSRAMPGQQKIILPENGLNDEHSAELIIYPGLTDANYDAILQFARTEHWPITPSGMFTKLQKEGISPSLEEAFYHTPYFMSVEMLFGRLDKPVKNTELLQIILQGNWEQLSTFYFEQRALLDLSQARRQNFLLSYVDQGSKGAAAMLLKTEGKNGVLQFDNHRIVKILNLLDETNPPVIDLVMTIIKNSRNIELVQAANNRLRKFNEQSSLPIASLQNKPVFSRTAPPQQFYIVKEGDSLWKISKNLKVSINKLADINHLDDSSILQPGMQLTIP